MNILSDEQVATASSADEPVHALVVGVSDYPHANAVSDDPERRRYAVPQLSSAARSASWFAGWLTTSWSRRNDIASLELLLSPVDEEVIDDRVADAWSAAGSPAATLREFRLAFARLRTATEGKNCVAVVYLTGHGVQVSGRSATVLLNDYLAPGHVDTYESAIDSVGCHAACDDGRFATKQFWFVDACRQASSVEREYEHLYPGWAPRDRARGSAEVAPIYLSSLPWTSALAERGGRSLFSQALEWSLDGNVGSQRPGSDDDRVVSTFDLQTGLQQQVALLAAEHGRDQSVQMNNATYAIVHDLVEPPAKAKTPSPEPADQHVSAPRAAPPDRPAGAATTATLRLSVALGSMHLQGLTPFEIIAENGTPIATVTGPQSIDVRPGTYQVCVRPPGGDCATITVEAAAGEVVDVRHVVDLDVTSSGEQGTSSDTDRVQLAEVSDALVLTTEPGLWTFRPESADPPMVPRATFLVAGRAMTISLPVNPMGSFPDDACMVRTDETLGVRATFAPERKVSAAVEAALGQEVSQTSIEVIEQSSQLLMAKYREPVAAVLGGLALHRMGRLRERQTWVENLARDFSWLPDGRGLHAALLSVDEDDDRRTDGLDLLLDAAQHRPMYTDGLALIVSLLQRWPSDDRRDERRDQLGRAGPLLARADLRSVFLLTEDADQP